MIPYILAENPKIQRKKAFKLSKKMMKGNKWKTFILDLSFLGWELLSIFTFGLLNIFYINPYKVATTVELYEVLKKQIISQKSEYYEELNSLELINNILGYISVKQGVNTIESRSMTINDYEQKISKIEDEKVKKLLIYSDFNSDSMYLLATDKKNYTNSKVIKIKEDNDKNTIHEIQDLNNDDINNEKVFVRLVFDIHNETMIIGGDGTSTNPFILKGGATPCQ